MLLCAGKQKQKKAKGVSTLGEGSGSNAGQATTTSASGLEKGFFGRAGPGAPELPHLANLPPDMARGLEQLMAELASSASPMPKLDTHIRLSIPLLYSLFPTLPLSACARGREGLSLSLSPHLSLSLPTHKQRESSRGEERQREGREREREGERWGSVDGQARFA